MHIQISVAKKKKKTPVCLLLPNIKDVIMNFLKYQNQNPEDIPTQLRLNSVPLTRGNFPSRAGQCLDGSFMEN